MTWLSYALDHALWGMDPRGYHLTDVLLHAANAALFCVLARRLLMLAAPDLAGGDPLGTWLAAGFAAMLFSIHPLRAESVAWVSARHDVLSGAFYLCSCLCYLGAHEARVRPRQRLARLLACGAFFVCALASWAITVGLFWVFVALDFYPLRRLPADPRRWLDPGARAVWLEKLPFLLIALIAGMNTLWGSQASLSIERHGLPERITLLLYGPAFYVRKTFLPLDLSPLYQASANFNDRAVAFSAHGAATLAATAAFFAARRRWPGALAAWLCYLAVLAPVTGVLPRGPQLAADRYTYLSCLPWAALGGWALLRFRSRATARGLAAAALLVLGLLTWRQAGVWHDDLSLWRHALSIDEKSYMAHYNLGTALLNRGSHASAGAHLRRCMELKPDYVPAYVPLAAALSKQGRFQEALPLRRRVLSLGTPEARGRAHNDLGGTFSGRETWRGPRSSIAKPSGCIPGRSWPAITWVLSWRDRAGGSRPWKPMRRRSRWLRENSTPTGTSLSLWRMAGGRTEPRRSWAASSSCARTRPRPTTSWAACARRRGGPSLPSSALSGRSRSIRTTATRATTWA
ncbi:MAG: tetratricopeptide repeat protein [Elusimicrobiota bacterium]